MIDDQTTYIFYARIIIMNLYQYHKSLNMILRCQKIISIGINTVSFESSYRRTPTKL